MLGGEDHVRRAEERVGACGVDADDLTGAAVFVALGRLVPVAVSQREVDERAFAPADPVALHELDWLGPVNELEVAFESIGVARDPQHPLAQRPTVDRVVAPIGSALVGGDQFA